MTRYTSPSASSPPPPANRNRNSIGNVMPNHITNLVTISGPAADVDRFFAQHVKRANIAEFNDFHAHAEVLALFDETIARLEKAGQT